MRRTAGEVLGIRVLRGDMYKAWDCDIETTHIRPRMDRGLIKAVTASSEPHAALHTHIHNQFLVLSFSLPLSLSPSLSLSLPWFVPWVEEKG